MLTFNAPGSATFQGQGATDPSTLTYPRYTATPAASSGLQLAPGQQAVHALNKDLGAVATKLAPLLGDNMPSTARAKAYKAAQILNQIQAGYSQALQGSRAAAWDRPGVQNALRQYRIALGLVGQAADQLQLLAQGRVPALAPTGQPAVSWPGAQAMGIWSWNPNNWFLTEEEVRAKELAEAQHEVLLAQAEQAATNANPSLIDKVTGAVGSVATSASTGFGLGMFVAVAGGAALVYWAFKDPDRSTRAVGSLADTGARAGGRLIESGAKAGAGAAKLAAFL